MPLSRLIGLYETKQTEPALCCDCISFLFLRPASYTHYTRHSFLYSGMSLQGLYMKTPQKGFSDVLRAFCAQVCTLQGVYMKTPQKEKYPLFLQQEARAKPVIFFIFFLERVYSFSYYSYQLYNEHLVRIKRTYGANYNEHLVRIKRTYGANFGERLP